MLVQPRMILLGKWSVLAFVIFGNYAASGFRRKVAHFISEHNGSRSHTANETAHIASDGNSSLVDTSIPDALPASSQWRVAHQSADHTPAKQLVDAADGVPKMVQPTENRSRGVSDGIAESSFTSFAQKMLGGLAVRFTSAEPEPAQPVPVQQVPVQQVQVPVLSSAEAPRGESYYGWIIALFLLCSVCVCCAIGEMVFREQDERRRHRLRSLHEAQVPENRKSASYQFGDITRNIIASGKESRGGGEEDAGYRFGDISRGIVSKAHSLFDDSS